MNKQITLDNGLKIFLRQDKTKNQTIADIHVNAGGKDMIFYVNKKKHSLPNGVAHFLEHYLLEQSIYGNLGEVFKKDYIDSNAATSSYETSYYFSTVHDFKKNFIKLMNIVNKPVFSQDRVNKVKKPIISEIHRKNDGKYIEYAKVCQSALYKNSTFNITLGEIDDISNMDVEYLKDFHSAFYRPENQMIFLTGKFDDDIIDLIKETYDSFKYSDDLIEKQLIKEPYKVNKKNAEYKKDLKENFVDVMYKIDISKLSPLEKNKFDYYMSYILKTNFGEESKTFDYLIKNKLSLFAISYSYSNFNIKDFVTITLEVRTKYYDKVVKLLRDKMKNPLIDEKSFNKWKNKTIISNINSLESINWQTNNFIGNIVGYGLYQVDDLNFIKDLNYKECKELYNIIDQTNYSIVKNIGQE